jgi:hypothetical protein
LIKVICDPDEVEYSNVFLFLHSQKGLQLVFSLPHKLPEGDSQVCAVAVVVVVESELSD